MLAFAMIETADGMANLDAIATTPGLDGLYVGPADLTLSLTQGRLSPGFDREEPEMIAALQTIVAACKRNGIRAALHCGTPDYAARAIGWGFDMTTVGGDSRFLAAAAGAAVAGFRKLTETAGTAATKGGLLMPHVLVAGKLHPAGSALLEVAPGVTFTHVEEISEPSYAPLIGQADALVIRTQPLSAATVAAAPRLQIVSRHGVGYDAVDVAALNARGIPLCIVGDVNSVSVAEHALMLMLAAAKRLVLADRATRDGPWGWRNTLQASELAGKNLLILGYGRIGRHIARMAAGFDMQIAAHDPYLTRTGWPEGPVRAMPDLAAALAWADVVSLNLPKPDRPVLGATELALMKPTAIVINTARGGLIDEVALADALREGRLGAAGIDTFDDEPPPADHPLMALPQAILTPHTAALTRECAERMAIASVQNVLDFFAGTLDPGLIVNRNHPP